MTLTQSKAGRVNSRLLRKSAILASLCVTILVGSAFQPNYAYGDALSDAKAALATAKKELEAANSALSAAENAFASVKATKAKVDAVNSQANARIVNDIVFPNQTPVYVQVNGSGAAPANSVLVGVEGQYTDDGWTRQRAIDYVNQARRDAYNSGLVNRYVPLTWSSNLERTAQVRAAEISIYGDHTRPSGESWHGVSDEGLMPGYAENLSWGGSYETNIKMWIDEKECYRKYLSTGKNPGCVYGHYRNLVNPSYSVIGIAQFNSNRSTVNPYGTAMAAEFSGSGASGSADVKPLNQNIYQGVWVKASALVANSTQFSPSAVSGNPVWTRNAQVKHLNSLARSMASTEWARVQKDYNTKQAAVTAAQTRVNAAWDKVDAAQIKVDSLQPLKRQEIYRLYHPSTGEHLYTTDANERDVLKTKHGWKYEGVAWASTTWSKKAVYRLFHPVSGDHHYTADLNEVKVLSTSHGWRREGIKWYSDDAQGKAVYRVFHSGLRVGQHHYTLDAHEVSVLTTKHGWKYEGVAWYGAK